MKLGDYSRLFKFRYHLSFILVVLGALIFTHQPWYLLIVPLLITYVSFNVLLYGGLYTLNDIADIESDGRHPKKKNRPLPSKKISIKSAYIFSSACILLGLTVAWFYFGKDVLLMYLSFILVNQIYTRVAKKIPYVEILFNSLTYPMRFFLGVLLVTHKIPYFLLLAILLFAFGFACIRRIIEKRAPGSQARPVLQYYAQRHLIFLQIAALILIVAISIIDYRFYGIWYVIITVLYLAFIVGIYPLDYFVNFYQYLFLN